MHVISMIDTVDDDELVASSEERLGVEALTTIIINFKGDNIDGYVEMASILSILVCYTFAPKNLDPNWNNRVNLLIRPFIDKPSILELKDLPSYLLMHSWEPVTPCRLLL